MRQSKFSTSASLNDTERESFYNDYKLVWIIIESTKTNVVHVQNITFLTFYSNCCIASPTSAITSADIDTPSLTNRQEDKILQLNTRAFIFGFYCQVICPYYFMMMDTFVCKSTPDKL